MSNLCQINLHFRAEKRHKGTENKALSLTLMLILRVSRTFCLFNFVALVIFGCCLPQELLSAHISTVQPALPLTVQQHNNLRLSLIGTLRLNMKRFFGARQRREPV